MSESADRSSYNLVASSHSDCGLNAERSRTTVTIIEGTEEGERPPYPPRDLYNKDWIIPVPISQRGDSEMHRNNYTNNTSKPNTKRNESSSLALGSGLCRTEDKSDVRIRGPFLL